MLNETLSKMKEVYDNKDKEMSAEEVAKQKIDVDKHLNELAKKLKSSKSGMTHSIQSGESGGSDYDLQRLNSAARMIESKLKELLLKKKLNLLSEQNADAPKAYRDMVNDYFDKLNGE